MYPSTLESVTGILARLEGERSLTVLHRKDLAPISPRLTNWNDVQGIDDSARSIFAPLYPEGLFQHQSKAIEAISEKHHVVVTTQTSSGKSLIYTVPIAQSLQRDANATAMLLFPQKALANDQHEKLMRLLSSVDPRVFRYDGSTHQEDRPNIRAQVRVLLTNPDMLHLAVLGWHEKHWQRFLSGLRYIILDEAHDYRGTFGSNVALILRRLNSILRKYNCQPQYIASSATMAAPAAHLEGLTEAKFVHIGMEQDGSVHGPKSFWVVQPSTHAFQTARELMQHLVDAGLGVIAFCTSRKSAENLASDFDESDLRIAVYRAGLLAERRLAIEKGLREGSIRGVFSTSALELGIDIGGLDVCICIGIPSTMMSLQQRVGRVGRAGRPGAIILIPEERPLDAYYAEQPEMLYSRETESLAINLQSRTLAIWHYGCAFKEANRDIDSLKSETIGEPLSRIAEEHRAGLDDPSFHADDVHVQYNVRAGNDARYTLLCDGQQIGEINRSQILREASPHSIYLHDRGRFRVVSIREKSKEVHLRRDHTRNRTDAYVHLAVKLQQTWRTGKNEMLSIDAGRLLVSETLVSLIERKPDGTTLHTFTGSQGLAANILPTTGVRFRVKNPQLLLSDQGPWEGGPGLAWNGLLPLLRSLMPALLGPCDLADIGAHSECDDNEATLYFFDQAYEGIDLTLSVAGRLQELLELGLSRLGGCDCEDAAGCFRCVRDPFVNASTNKASTLHLLTKLQSALEESDIQVIEVDPLPDRLGPFSASLACRECGKRHSLGSKFCSNCGNKISGE